MRGFDGHQPSTTASAASPGESPPHALPADAVARGLRVDPSTGLSTDEAQRRLAVYGRNLLPEPPRVTLGEMVLRQFRSFLILLLVLAAVVSIAIGEMLDAVVIFFIVVLNAGLGVIQESRAENAIQALKRLAAPEARVVRDSLVQSLPAADLVPGDVAIIQAGDQVPADLRLLDSPNLSINEASLTGESEASLKDAEAVLSAEAPLGDRVNCAYMGTWVAFGRGRGLVVATGTQTEMGRIAEMIGEAEREETPLERRLASLGRSLGLATLGVVAVVFAGGLVRALPFFELFLTAISLAVAAVPEGLPAVVTIVLAVGLQRMARRHALIRRLAAVETLGSTTVIASDKTGTLTKGENTVVQVALPEQDVEVSGQGFSPEGEFRCDGRPIIPADDPSLFTLLKAIALCNDAALQLQDGRWRAVGDPTEVALLVAAAKGGVTKGEAEAEYPRLAEIPFSAERKRMLTVHRDPAGGFIAFLKGAPAVVVERCAILESTGRRRPLEMAEAQSIIEKGSQLARAGLRVLAVAYRHLDTLPAQLEEAELHFTYLGLVAMSDPPRAEAAPAVRLSQQAGVKVIMVTGDHRETAISVAQQVGILHPGELAIEGETLDHLSDEEMDRMVRRTVVYARASPRHKVRIVDALKRQQEVVAVTGDGVNDAPALRRSDIGIAMGITGTDVAKEAADMVLTDDNFASIVAAIEEGRVIYSNIGKVVVHLVSCNLGEVLLVFVAVLMAFPLPLQPIQILWLNVITDSFPALALGVEKAEPGVMGEPPTRSRESVLSREVWALVFLRAILVFAASFAAFATGLSLFPGQLAGAQTMTFATLVMAEVLRAHSDRSLRHSLIALGPLANRTLLWASGASIGLLLLVLYLPSLQSLFGLVSLGSEEWLLVLALAAVPLLGTEIAKTIHK